MSTHGYRYMGGLSVLRARCVLCVSAGPRCSAILWWLRVLCGWGGSCACPGCGALVVLPSRRAPPFRPPCQRTLGRTGCAAHCAALRACAAAVLLLVLLWRAATRHWSLPPPRYQSRGYGGAAPWSSSAAAAEPWLVATVGPPPPRSLCGSLQPAPALLPIKGLLG